MHNRWLPLLVVALLLAGVSAAAVWWHLSRGDLLYYGDAQAHLDIARRIVDSRTPGFEQFGTVWLPLPHALMLPFVGNDAWWRNGLAGAFPSAACFVAAGLFLFAALRRIFDSAAAAASGAMIFALNPNLLYLQSTAMTEPVFFAALLGLLYATVRFYQDQSWRAVLLAAACSLAASLTRYEGWFLIPFVTLYFLLAAKKRRLGVAVVFGALASLAPLAWLAQNRYYYGNALEFYNGAYSAMAIYRRALQQGMARYGGDHDWPKAWLYFRTAARLCIGWPLVAIAGLGVVASLMKRAVWPLALLALPPLFYIWSVHSGGTPIFVPELWPSSYYNTRYGMAVLPLAALAGGALVALAPVKLRALVGVLVVAAAISPWLGGPRPETWICWKESEVNSEGRRAWTRAAAGYLADHYRRGSGVIVSFGDLTGILREAGIPLAESLHEGNGMSWNAAVVRPDLFLREEWAIAFSGDKVATVILRAERKGPLYRCVDRVEVKGQPVVEIYRRDE